MLNKCRIMSLAAALLLCTIPGQSPAETVPGTSAQTVVAPSGSGEKTAATTPVTSLRVGYADMAKIAEKSNLGKVAKAHFEAKADKLKAQIDTKQKLLEKQKATLEAKLPSYSPEQRAAKIKEYEKKVDELRKMLVKADKELKPMQEELLKEIYGKIEKAAVEYGAANGFSLIVVKKDLLYLGSNVDVQDVSDALIKHLAK
ncbi:MAG TPA: OmpH family outer membrane protein [Geobacteraceae bacterium]|nr:OmpH family outer membrane protein [Geobacteraceae bacterium]